MNAPAAIARDIDLAGVRLTPDPSGALWWADERMLIAADLHLEKGSAYAARGQMLPPYDTHATLTRLEGACARLKPREVVLLGDTFHDRKAEERLADDARARLTRLIAAVETWTWILGNHDPAPPQGLGGRVAEEIYAGPLVLGTSLRRGHRPARSPGTSTPPPASLCAAARSADAASSPMANAW